MCGIAGEISFDGAVSPGPLEGMAQAMRHRGPDDDGLWLDDSGRCGFAFRRLSIIDLSPLGHQPMIDEETGNVIVYNGEIYNFQALRRECEAWGAKFRSQSDTEVILALYRRFGPDCVTHLRGMFALAIWDARKAELFLARDRFGKKPLNYALTNNGLVFCSEIAPLSRHPRISREHDPEALELYLQCLVVPAPWTIYRAIRKLPPAHRAVLSARGLRVEKYWDIDYRPKTRLTDAEALEGFESKLTEAIRLRMIADVPLGALLSGGVDSSAVTAIMARLSGTPVKTFSIGFEEQDFNELPYANEAARVCGTDHHTQIVTAEVESLLPLMARHYGEPYGDSSAIPSFLVSRTARQSVTVALNGDGGDELLGGYPRYSLSAASLVSSRVLGRLVSADALLEPTVSYATQPSFLARASSRLLRDFVHPELRSFMNYRACWYDGARARLLPGGGNPALLKGWRRQWLADAAAHAGNPFDQMLYLDNHTYLPNDLLVKMDIASMHCSLEARSPLLDHELAEYCASLPLEMKLRRRTGKYLLKQLAAKTFGQGFVNRKKQGFGIPLERWLKGALRERVRDVLLDRTLMEPLDSGVIENTLDEFLSDTSRVKHTARIWGLLMYGFWRQTVDRDPPLQDSQRGQLSPTRLARALP